MTDLTKQKSDADTKRFWASAEQAAKEVAGWPAWKRLQQQADSPTARTADTTADTHKSNHHNPRGL